MRFRYLTDPLFVACLALYAGNRWLLEPSPWGAPFRSYLNDLICIPFCVPPMLFILRRLRLRDHDGPPCAHEIIVPLLLWSVVFELWLPGVPFFRGLATSDHVDVLCYAAGALVAGLLWNRIYGRRAGAPSIRRSAHPFLHRAQAFRGAHVEQRRHDGAGLQAARGGEGGEDFGLQR